MYNIIRKFKKAAGISVSMRNRLFVFLVALVGTMVLGVLIVLLMTKSLTVGGNEAESFVRKELSYVASEITDQCGDASVQLCLLSQSLSKSIEYQLSNMQLQMSDLQNHPGILESVLGNEFSRLQLALEKTECSGVFMVLDATVNPTLPNAENSRAGLYIRNSEPNVVGPDTTRLYLRGFPDIAHQNELLFQAEWDMEFDIQDHSFYHLPIRKYNETALPLSRLYYWSFEGVIPSLGEDVMVCSVPLIDSDGNAFGVCGFEISTMNFKLNFSPDDSVYKQIFCMLSLKDDGGLDTENALFSGSRKAFNNKENRNILKFTRGSRGLNIYTRGDGEMLMGLHEAIKLYPDDSTFRDQHFAVALLIPKQELDEAMSWVNMQLILICALLMCLGIGVSFFICNKYLSPIMKAFDTIRSDDINQTVKTNILEIDQLVDMIKALHTKENPLSDNLFEDFIGRIKTLTPTEMVIFRYYLEGKTNNEILSLMFISMNTLKTHNGHIYSKLNVSSKDELLLYIELIKKSGMLEEIL